MTPTSLKLTQLLRNLKLRTLATPSNKQKISSKPSKQKLLLSLTSQCQQFLKRKKRKKKRQNKEKRIRNSLLRKVRALQSQSKSQQM